MSAAVIPIPTAAMDRVCALRFIERLGGCKEPFQAPSVPAVEKMRQARVGLRLAVRIIVDDPGSTREERRRAREAARRANRFMDVVAEHWGELAPVVDLTEARARRAGGAP